VTTVNQKSPLLAVSEWVQGPATNLDQLIGKVVLVEVFQVNCPGCFLHALPQAIQLHQRYAGQGLVVLGLATAFEDFDKNTRENLVHLVQRGEVIGETQKVLAQQGVLNKEGRLPYQIPFPVAMDKLHKRENPVTDNEITAFIRQHYPYVQNQPAGVQTTLYQRVGDYLNTLDYHAETFEHFALKGTPSQLLVDKQGVLVDVNFGVRPELESMIQRLLKGHCGV
jgi:thiol-disulfide isomerase/thioredoxin